MRDNRMYMGLQEAARLARVVSGCPICRADTTWFYVCFDILRFLPARGTEWSVNNDFTCQFLYLTCSYDLICDAI